MCKTLHFLEGSSTLALGRVPGLGPHTDAVLCNPAVQHGLQFLNLAAHREHGNVNSGSFLFERDRDTNGKKKYYTREVKT